MPTAEVLPAARAYAAELARNCSPLAMATIAAQVLDDADGTFDEALARSSALLDRFVGAPDLREGVASFVEKRAPNFAPLGRPLGSG